MTYKDIVQHVIACEEAMQNSQDYSLSEFNNLLDTTNQLISHLNHHTCSDLPANLTPKQLTNQLQDTFSALEDIIHTRSPSLRA